jgi:hypothetical protein
MPSIRSLAPCLLALSAAWSPVLADHWVPEDFSGAKINYVVFGSYKTDYGDHIPFLKVSLLDSAEKQGSREYVYESGSEDGLNAMAALLARAKDAGERVQLHVDDDADIFRYVQFGAGGPTALSAAPAITPGPAGGAGFDPLGRMRAADRARIPLFGRAARAPR